MAIFRKVHTSFWSDVFISDLDQNKKLFYLYLITNERTKQCGIYEIGKKQIAYDLGINIDTVTKQLKFFQDNDKVMYNDATKEIAIKNWLKYNNSTSPKVVSCINKELKDVKHRVLIEYTKGMYTASQEEQDPEQDPEQDEKLNFPERMARFITWFNTKKGLHTEAEGKFQVLSSTDQNNLKTLFDKHKMPDFEIAVLNLYKSKWAKDNNGFTPSHFLRVDNFNKYLNQDSNDKPQINKAVHSDPVN